MDKEVDTYWQATLHRHYSIYALEDSNNDSVLVSVPSHVVLLSRASNQRVIYGVDIVQPPNLLILSRECRPESVRMPCRGADVSLRMEQPSRPSAVTSMCFKRIIINAGRIQCSCYVIK